MRFHKVVEAVGGPLQRGQPTDAAIKGLAGTALIFVVKGGELQSEIVAGQELPAKWPNRFNRDQVTNARRASIRSAS